MSLRRFLAYFLAVTAGSTVAFASFLSAPGAPRPETSLQEAGAETSPIPETARIFQQIEERQRHRFFVRRPQIALAD